LTKETKQTLLLASLSCTFGPTPDAPRGGTITRIGPSGCFVKTKAVVTRGQSLFLRVWTPENRWLLLRARVEYYMEGVGFGATFDTTAPEEADGLALLVAGLCDGGEAVHH